MKIGIPINERAENALMASRFGRALYYVIYDLETKEYEYYENPASMSTGGAGVKAAEFLVSQGVKAIITPKVGPNAERILRSSKLDIYEGLAESWLNLVKKFERNELRKI